VRVSRSACRRIERSISHLSDRPSYKTELNQTELNPRSNETAHPTARSASSRNLLRSMYSRSNRNRSRGCPELIELMTSAILSALPFASRTIASDRCPFRKPVGSRTDLSHLLEDRSDESCYVSSHFWMATLVYWDIIGLDPGENAGLVEVAKVEDRAQGDFDY
jgi:hypothetical protein